MSKKENEETEIVWHGQQENILKKWSEIGSSYRFMHDRAFLYYEKQNFRFALPVIVISTITGTANFAQASFPESWQSYVPLFAGFLNLSAGLITTVAQFLRVSELLEGHRAASIAYSKFSRNISVELSLPVDERSCGGREFIAWYVSYKNSKGWNCSLTYRQKTPEDAPYLEVHHRQVTKNTEFKPEKKNYPVEMREQALEDYKNYLINIVE